jgi:glycosyltransferase involved in cell wall biosynthesis
MPDISVIMIFLNPGEFFREAIASVLAQRFTNWELLLVDDGSTDGSQFVAEEAARQNPGRIYCLSHQERKNCGMSASRNLGLDHARGRFVAFLDSDDVWDSHYLASQFEILTAQPEAAAAFADTCVWYSWTRNPADSLRDRSRQSGAVGDKLLAPGLLIPIWLEMKEQTPATCSILIKTDVARRYGFDNSFRGMFEDQVFLYKLALNESVFISTQRLAYYRQHVASSCNRAQQAGAYDPNSPNQSHLKFLRWLKGYLAQENIKVEGIERALQISLHAYRISPRTLLRRAWKKTVATATSAAAAIRS